MPSWTIDTIRRFWIIRRFVPIKRRSSASIKWNFKSNFVRAKFVGENAKQSASLAKLRSQQSKLQSTLDELVLKSFSIEKSPFKVHVYILHASIQACHNACICFITCNRIPCLRLLGLFFAIVHAENPPLLRYQ